MKPKEYEYCKRCGRKLKSQESRMIGYGAICLQKSKESSHSIRLFPILSKNDKMR
jgi:hypothetical protein